MILLDAMLLSFKQGNLVNFGNSVVMWFFDQSPIQNLLFQQLLPPFNSSLQIHQTKKVLDFCFLVAIQPYFDSCRQKTKNPYHFLWRPIQFLHRYELHEVLQQKIQTKLFGCPVQ